MFGIGPAYLFMLQHRLPVGLMRRNGWTPWISTMATNLGHRRDRRHVDLVRRSRRVPARAPADHAARGLGRGVAVLCAAPVRRHRLGRATANGTATRRPCTAARTTTCQRCCAGSPPISACTTSIISPAAFPITDCRGALRDHPELRGISRVTLLQSFRCVRLALWCEATAEAGELPGREGGRLRRGDNSKSAGGERWLRRIVQVMSRDISWRKRLGKIPAQEGTHAVGDRPHKIATRAQDRRKKRQGRGPRRREKTPGCG